MRSSNSGTLQTRRNREPKIMRFYYLFIALCALQGFGFFIVSLCGYAYEQSTIGIAKQGVTLTLCKLYSVIGSFFLLSIFPGFYSIRHRVKGYTNWICYCIILGLIWALCLGACAYAYNKIRDSQSLVDGLLVYLEDYAKTRSERRLDGWDAVQLKYNCCGVRNYTDWQDVDFGRTSLRVPKSCCLPGRRLLPHCGQNLLPDHGNASSLINDIGCVVPIRRYANITLGSMAGFSVFSLVVIALVEALTLILISRRKL